MGAVLAAQITTAVEKTRKNEKTRDKFSIRYNILINRAEITKIGLYHCLHISYSISNI